MYTTHALPFSIEIDHKEARVKSLRSAIIETFPEPNRQLLLRYAFNVVFEIITKTVLAFYLGTELRRIFKSSAAYAMGNMWCSHGSPLFNLLQTALFSTRVVFCRILKMMHTITSHSCENRMTPSAVAACMSPLLLRPLLAGECDLDGFDTLEDNSAQLLAAANAANNAQAIVTALLEDYGNMINVRFPSII